MDIRCKKNDLSCEFYAIPEVHDLDKQELHLLRMLPYIFCYELKKKSKIFLYLFKCKIRPL